MYNQASIVQLKVHTVDDRQKEVVGGRIFYSGSTYSYIRVHSMEEGVYKMMKLNGKVHFDIFSYC